MEIQLDKEFLLSLAHYKMPFGKYKDSYLSELPEAYLSWFRKKGFPNGKLGTMLEATLEIKINGLEGKLRKIREQSL